MTRRQQTLKGMNPMAGYNWTAGKSNNAVSAEADGLMVASKIASWLRQWNQFAGCTAGDVARVLTACEWHHSSKFYNKVNYYDQMELMCDDVRRDLAQTIKQRKRFIEIIKKHGVDGRFMVFTPDGQPWHGVYKEDCYREDYLERMESTLDAVWIQKEKVTL